MVELVVVLFALPATLACLAYLVPTLAAVWWHRSLTCAEQDQALHTFVVHVPAHDEEATLPRTLACLASQDYPADRLRVVVVADNCGDHTPAVARAAGAACLEGVDAAR